MTDKSALLGQLKIDRQALPPAPRTWPWVLAGVLLLAGAAAAWAVLRPAPPVAVQLATAVAAAKAAASAGSVLDASGYVVARRQATVSSKITGKVMDLRIEEGMPVQTGQILARLDDANAKAQLRLTQSQWGASKAAVDEVQVQIDEARRQLQRARDLHNKKLVSEAALENAQANLDGLMARSETARLNAQVADRNVALARQQLEDTVVRAPFDGIITVKNAQLGEMISPLSAGGAGTRTGIGTLVDMQSLEIEVDVNENFINRVRPDQPVSATLNAYPDWRIPCAVIAVIPTADRSKATVKVRIAIQLADERILPDMGVRVSFLEQAAQADAPSPTGVYVPATAVHRDGERDVVYVAAEGIAQRRAVTVGETRGSSVQILGGLSAGEKVVQGNLQAVADGARIVAEDQAR